MCLVVVPVVSFFLPLSGDKKIHAKISKETHNLKKVINKQSDQNVNMYVNLARSSLGINRKISLRHSSVIRLLFTLQDNDNKYKF